VNEAPQWIVSSLNVSVSRTASNVSVRVFCTPTTL
jgi:hypothetical protein